MYIQKDKHYLTVMFIQVCFVHKRDISYFLSNCNVRAIRYKRILSFLGIAATRFVLFVAASFTSLFAMVPRTVNAAAHPCLRGLSRRMVPRISCPYRLHVAKRHSSAPAAIWSRRLCVVPRTRMLPLIHGA